MNDPTSSRALLAAGDALLFIDRKEREYMRILRAGARMHIRSGYLLADDLIGQPEGREVRNSGGETFIILRPTYATLIPNLPRKAQVIYPKDIGPILLWGDIGPGMRVFEVGTGPGALTIAMLRAVGPTGEVISYEVRPEFIDMARGNVAQFFGAAPNWTIKLRDIADGIEERDLDRMVLDLAEPWAVLPAAAAALRPGGVLVAYVPTVMQVKQFVDQARLSGFGAVQSMETLMRTWHIQGLSIRPDHRMIAHTGFITVCRRILAAPPLATADGLDDADGALEPDEGTDADDAAGEPVAD
ncbi:MAG: tRNA (adenine-N1)-methyltransferase [Candidatus Binatia bacterium]